MERRMQQQCSNAACNREGPGQAREGWVREGEDQVQQRQQSTPRAGIATQGRAALRKVQVRRNLKTKFPKGELRR